MICLSALMRSLAERPSAPMSLMPSNRMTTLTPVWVSTSRWSRAARRPRLGVCRGTKEPVTGDAGIRHSQRRAGTIAKLGGRVGRGSASFAPHDEPAPSVMESPRATTVPRVRSEASTSTPSANIQQTTLLNADAEGSLGVVTVGEVVVHEGIQVRCRRTGRGWEVDADCQRLKWLDAQERLGRSRPRRQSGYRPTGGRRSAAAGNSPPPVGRRPPRQRSTRSPPELVWCRTRSSGELGPIAACTDEHHVADCLVGQPHITGAGNPGAVINDPPPAGLPCHAATQ